MNAPQGFEAISRREQGLQRRLSAAQMSMIAIGGAIGTGLFMGSAFAIGFAGPSVLLSYAASVWPMRFSPESMVVIVLGATMLAVLATQATLLTPDQRQVIALKFWHDWENEEIARALHKPVGAVKSLQHRALNALERYLQDQ